MDFWHVFFLHIDLVVRVLYIYSEQVTCDTDGLRGFSSFQTAGPVNSKGHTSSGARCWTRLFSMRGFHSHGGTPITGSLILENPHENPNRMDDLGATPILGNLHIYMVNPSDSLRVIQ
jgi:hypothetical protein